MENGKTLVPLSRFLLAAVFISAGTIEIACGLILLLGKRSLELPEPIDYFEIKDEGITREPAA